MAKSARDFVDDEHDDLIKLTAAQYELSEEAASAIADILQDKCSVAVYRRLCSEAHEFLVSAAFNGCSITDLMELRGFICGCKQ